MICSTCRVTKAIYECQICNAALCEACGQIHKAVYEYRNNLKSIKETEEKKEPNG